MHPTLSLAEVDAVVASKTAPRVTLDSITARIVAVDYLAHGTTTIAVLVLDNGFKFIGTSTPASDLNFDGEVGKRYAYDNAFKQIWTHEGYLLRERLIRESV